MPAKLEENEERRKRRTEAADKVKELWSQKQQRAIYDKEFMKSAAAAIKVTQEMIERIIGALKMLNIPFCVAPFEADAQLA